MAAAAAALALLAPAGCGLEEAADKAAETTKQLISPWNLEPGTCYDDKNIASGRIESIKAIPCTDPHNSQIVDVIDYPAGTQYAELSDKAKEDCGRAFEEKLLPEVYEAYSAGESSYEGAFLYPMAADWRNDASNKVACVLQSKEPVSESALS